jgi:hypothetical protein
MPTTPPSDKSTVADFSLSTVTLYGRSLSDDEISVLNARDFDKDDEAVKKLTDAAAEPVNLANGLLASGDSLSALASAAPQTGLTFSAVVSLPEGEDPVSGTLFTVGDGDDAVVLGVEDDRLFWRAGSSRISQRVALPRGNDDAGNPNSIHVAASYNGELIKLYVNGNIYKRVHWNTIWLITTGISILLLAALAVFFRDDVRQAPKTESADQGQQA